MRNSFYDKNNGKPGKIAWMEYSTTGRYRADNK